MSVLREVSALSSVNTFSECTAPKRSPVHVGAADNKSFLLLHVACLIVLFSLLIYAAVMIVCGFMCLVVIVVIPFSLYLTLFASVTNMSVYYIGQILFTATYLNDSQPTSLLKYISSFSISWITILLTY